MYYRGIKTMSNVQQGILEEIPPQARFLTFGMHSTEEMRFVLNDLLDFTNSQSTVIGLGASLVNTLGGNIPGSRTFPALSANGIDIPSTPAALWCWLRGDDRGELLHRSRLIEETLLPSFSLEHVLDCFQYGTGRDLTGYEDGTENPKGQDAIDAAIVQGQGEGLDGSSFVAVQQWLHDLDAFGAREEEEQDNIIGRRISDNEELDDAPVSAHVKRTAQESFDPEAFILRRSIPWADEMEAGLHFIAFGKSFDAYETLLKNMLGMNDGITDALFSFTQPISGSYYWCPPVKEGRLDLRAVGID